MIGNRAMNIDTSSSVDMVAINWNLLFRVRPSLDRIIDLTLDARMMLKMVMEYNDTREPIVDRAPRVVQSRLEVHTNCVIQVLLLKNCSPIDSTRRNSP